MTGRDSLRMARHLRGLLKAQHPAELKEQLRIWVDEFNRQAATRKRNRRPKIARRASA